MKKVLLSLIGCALLSSCFSRGPTCGGKSTHVSFSTYDELVNEMKLEDEYKKSHPSEIHGYYSNYPMFDARLEGAESTTYLKFGMTTCVRGEGSTLVMRYRFACVENLFNNHRTWIYFKNNKNIEETTYNPQSFYWKEEDETKGPHLLRSYIDNPYDEVYGRKLPNLYVVKDINDNTVAGFYISCKNSENKEIVFNQYKDELLKKCKEMAENLL